MPAPGIVAGVAVALLLTLVLEAARRAKPQINVATGEYVIRYGIAPRALAWILVPGGAAIGFVAFKASPSIYVATAICLAVAAAVVSMLVEFTRVSASWSERGLTLNSPWRGVITLSWNEIADVNFAISAGWFVLRGQSGEVIRLSKWLGGLSALLDELRKRVAPTLHLRIDEAVASYQRMRR